MRSGHGREINSDDSIYTGEFARDMRNGSGKQAAPAPNQPSPSPCQPSPLARPQHATARASRSGRAGVGTKGCGSTGFRCDSTTRSQFAIAGEDVVVLPGPRRPEGAIRDETSLARVWLARAGWRSTAAPRGCLLARALRGAGAPLTRPGPPQEGIGTEVLEDGLVLSGPRATSCRPRARPTRGPRGRPLAGAGAEQLVRAQTCYFGDWAGGKSRVGKGGVVRDPAAHRDAIEAVVAAAAESGWQAQGLVASPITGPAGNHEYVLWLGEGEAADLPDLDTLVAQTLNG